MSDSPNDRDFHNAASAQEFLVDMEPLRKGDLGVACDYIEALLAEIASWKKVAREYEMALSDRGLL